jgi:N-acetylmuramoyl-L-alanine amidase
MEILYNKGKPTAMAAGKEKGGGNLQRKRIFTNTKRTVLFLITLCTLAFAMMPAASAASATRFPDGAVPVRVTLDGQAVLEGQTAIIHAVTYVPLRAFSELAGADEVTWNAKTRTAAVKNGGYTVYVTDGSVYVEAAGRYVHTGETVRNIDGRLYVPVRALAKVFSMNVTWNELGRTVELRRTGELLRSASDFYNADDLYWLSRIIHAEAGGESLEGKIAVGNVVLNRKASAAYPNTVYGVIFDRKHGTQFTPVATGTIYRTPSAESVIAAKICLEGHSISREALFFMNPRIATNFWIANHCRFLFRIGNHDFYGLK